MTNILFAGGEDTSFTLFGSAASTTAGTLYRTAFARTAIAVTAASSADPPAHRIVGATSFTTPSSDFWVHAQVNCNTGNTTTNNNQAIILRSPDGVGRVYIRQTGTAGTLKASIANAARSFTDLATATGTFAATTQTALDMRVIYGGTASDQIQLYINGALVIDYTGASIRTDGATQLNQLELSQIGIPQFNGWSEVIVSDTDTRGKVLWTLAPTGPSGSQAWTPNTVGNINEVIISDATVVSTTTNDAFCEWIVPVTPPSGAWALDAIVQEARIQKGATGPQNFDWLVKIAGADYAAGVTQAPATTFANFSHIWANNPATLGPWNISNIATGFHLGVKSLA